MTLPLAFLDSFSGAFDFIFSQQESFGGGTQVGGLGQVGELMLEHLKVSGIALAVSLALALPLGLLLGHRGTGELFAIAAGNAGRAIPELALIALLVAFVGTGTLNVADRARGPRHPADPHQHLRRRSSGRSPGGRGGAGNGDERARRSPCGSSCRSPCRRS